MKCVVVLPGKWVNARQFDRALIESGGPHSSRFSEVEFHFASGCKIMSDVAVELLSLVTQLNYAGKSVRLIFADGLAGTMGYLDRMGFFTYLPDDVDCCPERPHVSGATIYAGNSKNLVEIQEISPKKRNHQLPGQLASILEDAVINRPDHESLSFAAFTVFAELIDNVYEHSATELNGYAALQVYPNGGIAQVIVSDSGLGIMKTLRPNLPSPYQELSDVDLLVEIFRQGLSRYGEGRGCGLKQSAAKAIKYRANLNVRLPSSRVVLVPSPDGYTPNTAYCSINLPELWGTHITFEFRLDI